MPCSLQPNQFLALFTWSIDPNLTAPWPVQPLIGSTIHSLPLLGQWYFFATTCASFLLSSALPGQISSHPQIITTILPFSTWKTQSWLMCLWYRTSPYSISKSRKIRNSFSAIFKPMFVWPQIYRPYLTWNKSSESETWDLFCLRLGKTLKTLNSAFELFCWDFPTIRLKFHSFLKLKTKTEDRSASVFGFILRFLVERLTETAAIQTSLAI